MTVSSDLTEEIIDSRTLIAHLEDIELDAVIRGYLEEDEFEERNAIRELADEVSDWTYGATLIREDHFEDYAQQLAEDIGAVSADESWPKSCIDWEQAADELRMDYSSVTFMGTSYYVRP